MYRLDINEKKYNFVEYIDYVDELEDPNLK